MTDGAHLVNVGAYLVSSIDQQAVAPAYLVGIIG